MTLFKKKGVIGGLIEQIPNQIWVIVPDFIRSTTDSKYRLVRAKNFSQKATIERGIVEAFKYASKIGLRTAVFALVVAIKNKKTTMANIIKTAKEMGFERPLRTHWELISGAIQD